MQRRGHGAASHVDGLEAAEHDILRSKDKESRAGRGLCRVLCLAAATSTLIILLLSAVHSRRHSRHVERRDLQHQPPAEAHQETWPMLPQPRWRSCLEEGDQQPREDGQQHAPGPRFMLVQLAGGLNQMRAGICDAVVVAYILNATLVLPLLDNTSWWADLSGFEDVFDAQHFISTLAPAVNIVRALPLELRSVSPLVKKVPRGSQPEYFEAKGGSFFRKKPVLRFDHFDSRLADIISAPLQQLRCKANYKALRFVADVRIASLALLSTLRASSPHFVALHLRYEPDMLAFTGCDYAGSETDKQQLEELRKRWPNLPPADPQGQMAKGLCVTSPEQVAVGLRSLDIPSATPLYIASGPLWRGAAALEPLQARFPTIVTKQALSGWKRAHGGAANDEGMESGGADVDLEESRVKEVVGRVLSKPALMAAVDYEVCRQADVFVANNRGNMAALLTGHRRFDGRMETVKVFGSAVYALLSKAAAGAPDALTRLRAKLLRITEGHNASLSATLSSVLKEGFYNFPRDCLCPL